MTARNLTARSAENAEVGAWVLHMNHSLLGTVVDRTPGEALVEWTRSTEHGREFAPQTSIEPTADLRVIA